MVDPRKGVVVIRSNTKAANLAPRSGSSVEMTRAKRRLAHVTHHRFTPARTVRQVDSDSRASMMSTTCVRRSSGIPVKIEVRV